MDKSSDKIQKMFDSIASMYDFNNNFISLGLHKVIKKLGLKELELKKNVSVLDLCTGTGDIARLIQKTESSAKIIGVDFSDKMLKIAREKSEKITYLNADCTNLPFEENSFDICTISFGLRNIQDKDRVLEEIFRVLKNGGQFMHLDFGSGNFLFNFIFDFVLGIILKIFYKNSKPYEYLIRSKKEFESPQRLIQIFSKHGFKPKICKNFLGGIISVQVLEK